MENKTQSIFRATSILKFNLSVLVDFNSDVVIPVFSSSFESCPRIEIRVDHIKTLHYNLNADKGFKNFGKSLTIRLRPAKIRVYGVQTYSISIMTIWQ